MKSSIKQVFLAAALVLCTAFCGLAQSPSYENSLLWKIEGNGIQPSYLFGTFHILPQKDFELKSKVKVALDNSDLLVMELNMSSPTLQSEIMRNASMKDGKTLDQVFSKIDYEKVDKALINTLGVGIQNLITFKPFMLSSFLLSGFVGGQPASFELTLTQMATTKEMDIKGLESVAEQMSIFDEIPYESQAADVMEMIDEKEKTQDMFDEMIQKYKSEDLNGIDKMMADYFDSEEELDLLLNNRNRNWIPKIGAFAKTQSTFFGVGAGHLGGASGLIALLRKAGYSVNAVQ